MIENDEISSEQGVVWKSNDGRFKVITTQDVLIFEAASGKAWHHLTGRKLSIDEDSLIRFPEGIIIVGAMNDEPSELTLVIDNSGNRGLDSVTLVRDIDSDAH